MLLMCWVITCLSSTMTCLFFCGAEAQYWGGGAWGRKDAFNDEIPKWLEVCIHDEKRLIVNNLRGRNSFVCFCLQSCSWSVPWRWCVFRRIACFCSIWPGPAKHVKCLQQEMLEGGERKYLHTAQRMRIYEFAQLDMAKAKTRERTWMCEWISEARILLWDITRLLVVVFLFWVHKDLSRLRGCSYHSKKLWMGRTLRRSSQGINWCNGWQNFPTFRLVILHKQ